MADIHQGINLTQTDTTAQFPLGLEVEDPRGGINSMNRFRYVKAAAAITGGQALRAVYTDSDEPNVLTPVGSGTHSVVAIAIGNIASGNFGWVQTRGRHSGVRIGSAITEGAVLTATEVTTTADAGELVVLTHGTAFSSTVSAQLQAAAAGVGVIAVDSASTSDTTVEVIIQ